MARVIIEDKTHKHVVCPAHKEPPRPPHLPCEDKWSNYYTKSETEGFIKEEVERELEGIEPLTAEQKAYLDSKLAYTYSYLANITTPKTTIDFPTNDTNVVFSVNVSATKKNDMSQKILTISDVKNFTEGWVKTFADRLTKTISIDKTGSGCSSGSFSATVEAEDGTETKTGSCNASSVSVRYTKPFFVFQSSSTSITSASVVEGLINGTTSNLYTKRSAGNYSASLSVSTSGNYFWFAIPNTLTLNAVTQMGLNFLAEGSTTITGVSLGNYKLYRSVSAQDTSSKTIDIIIK